MNCAACGDHAHCPLKMADGRAFTDYRPRCAIDFEAISKNSYDYRQYMIQNAEAIMQKNRNVAYDANKCGPCVAPFNQGTMLPEQSMIKCNASTCTFSLVNPNGLGMGRQYGPDVMTDRERAFLRAREQEGVCCAPFNQGTQGTFANLSTLQESEY